MKTFGTSLNFVAIVILSVFSSQGAIAESLPPKLQGVADFITKKGSCAFAVAEVPKDGQYNSYHVRAWREQLLCVQDLTAGEGTIDEAKGCALSWFNSETNRYLPVQTMDSFGRAELTVVKGKPCANGGFEELVKMKLGMYGASSVLGKLTRPSSSDSKTVILVSSSTEYRKSIEKAIAEVELQAKAEEAKAAEKKKQNQIKAEAKKELQKKQEKESLTKIDGSWIGPCKDKEDFSDRQSMVFSNGKYEVSVDSFKSTGCKAANRYERIILNGKYKVGEIINAKGGTKAIDQTNLSAKFKIFDQDYAAQVSESGKFGLISVVANREYDITKSKELAPLIGKTSFGIFKLNGMELNFEKEDSTLDKDPKNRSKLQLDLTSTFKRQSKKISDDPESTSDSEGSSDEGESN